MEQNNTTSAAGEEPHEGRDGGGQEQPKGERAQQAADQVFRWIRSTGLHRPDDGWLGGVLASLAAHTGFDRALVRGIAIICFVLLFSPSALLYGLAWLLLPDSKGRIHGEQVLRSNLTTGGLGALALSGIGLLSMVMPISLAGPFAGLVNLAIVGAAVWIVWSLSKKHSERSADGDTSSPAHSAKEEAPGKGRAGNSSFTQDESKPAWYPKTTEFADDDSATARSEKASRPTDVQAPSHRSVVADQAEAQTPQAPDVQQTNHRRGLVTLGLLLLIIPGLIAVGWIAPQLGVSSTRAVLITLAGVVVVLAVWHIIAAARGRKGRGGMLTLATLAMMLFMGSEGGIGPGLGNASNHVFGDYVTTDEQVNSAFSRTTMDLRHLGDHPATSPGLRETGQGQPQTHHWAEVNTAFSQVTVIVPDGAQVSVDNSHALGQLNIETQDHAETISGLSGNDVEWGPEDAPVSITLDLNSALGQVNIYDATAYQNQVGDLTPRGAPQ